MAVITVADLKAHLNAVDEFADDFLEEKIAAASGLVAAYVDPALVPDMDQAPAPIREAVRLLASHLVENREATLVGVSGQALPFGVFDLVGPFRKFVF
jgi:hypothetical protein